MKGHQSSADGANPLLSAALLVESMLARVNTIALVKITKVTSNGQLDEPGFVDFEVLVTQIHGDGDVKPGATVHRCPYFRLQGGRNAVIIDPKVGDIGLAAFSSRDISSVVTNKGKANPGSRRMFDLADGLYFGAFLGQTPTQFVRFHDGGIQISSTVEVALDAPDIKIDCQRFSMHASQSAEITTPTLTLNGNMMTTGNSTTQGNVNVTGNVNAAASVIAAATVSGSVVMAGTKNMGTHTHIDSRGGGTGQPL